MLRIVIAGRKSMHSIKTTYTGREDGSFGTTGYNHICFTQTDIVKCVSDSI